MGTSIREKHTVDSTDITKACRGGKGFLGGAPKSDSNRPEDFMSWLKLGAQGLVMRPRKKVRSNVLKYRRRSLV